jgi:hypothetical protein
VEIICGLLILLFVYAAVSKLADYTNFKLTIRFAPLVKEKSDWIAWALPVGELIVATLLFMPKYRLTGLYCSLIIMFLFTAYVGYALVFRSAELPCSCGGVLNQLGWKYHFIFNVFFTLLSFIGILLYQNKLNFFIAISRRSRKPVTSE